MVSPQKAADRAGVSRRTVMVAIEGFKLKAIRDNRNRWQIDPDDLSRWIDERDTSHDATTAGSTDTPTDGSSAADVELRIENARLEARLEAANTRIADLEKRVESRDTDYQRVLALLDEAQKPKGFFDWLMRKIEK